MKWIYVAANQNMITSLDSIPVISESSLNDTTVGIILHAFKFETKYLVT